MSNKDEQGYDPIKQSYELIEELGGSDANKAKLVGRKCCFTKGGVQGLKAVDIFSASSRKKHLFQDKYQSKYIKNQKILLFLQEMPAK